MPPTEQLKQDPCTVIFVKTVNVLNIKTLSNVLKNVSNDFGVLFDSNGIHLTSAETTDLTNIEFTLNKESFEDFTVKHDVEIVIEAERLYKAIKPFRNDSILTLYMYVQDEDDDDWNNLFIMSQQSDNDDTGTTQTFKLRGVPKNMNTIEKPSSYDVRIKMEAQKLQEYIKNKQQIDAYFIEFQCIDDYFIMESEGNVCDSKSLLYNDGYNILDIERNESMTENQIIYGKYNLDQLLQILKCTEMSGRVYVDMKNKYPVRLSFAAGKLGNISFTVNPKEES
jgi:DNA polymerase III sliding clamp (beta) subunit (PCNA family)